MRPFRRRPRLSATRKCQSSRRGGDPRAAAQRCRGTGLRHLVREDACLGQYCRDQRRDRPDALLRRAMAGIDSPGDLRQPLVGTKAICTAREVSHQGSPIGSEGSRYRLLHVHRQGEEQRALFRLLRPRRNLLLSIVFSFAMPTARCGLVTFTITPAGSWIRMTFTGRLFVMRHEASPDFFRKLSPMDCDYVGHVDAVRKMREYVAAERFQEALDVYQRMPELLKKHRHVLHQRFLACCQVWKGNSTKPSAPTAPHLRLIRGSTCIFGLLSPTPAVR